MRTLSVWLRSGLLLAIGIAVVLWGGFTLADGVILRHAQAWPHVPATLEQCAATLQYGRHSAYWEVSARFRYGDGREYVTTWQPADGLTDEHDPTPARTDAQTAAYCGAAAQDGLRVSPAYPGIARLNSAAMSDEWEFRLMLGAALLLVGLVNGFTGFWLLRHGDPPPRRLFSRE
ncbi:hypothetical protein BLA23254_05806 [Burkholderia lata]|uniref:DUF3592 domain-containing protein n=1 Tax=Burkholderia lata (strain ATCC 17760 / DSM 23089 / LMG 22485 / NCIMB 9086 / R18194 / 383) TaxID=482957 RepID=A0A6P2QGU6_BURL3|nr:DUF3592 domain-containing protein [Burkholderia lata]VWC21150.1 hypothetical protein BLA23254_05806 [Burkholderia lata]